MYDIIIIGAGPAGISAGIYAVSRGMKTLVIEKASIGGTIGKVSTVTHYSALIQDETGETFANRMKAQALASGVEIIYETVIETKLQGDIKEIHTEVSKNDTDGKEAHVYLAKTVIIAAGCTPRRLNITGEDRLWGKGIGMNAAKSAENYAGKNVYVVGGADGAVKEALYLSKFAQSVTIIHFEDTLGCIPEFLNKVKAASNIRVLTSSRLSAVYGEHHVEALDIKNETDNTITTIKDDNCGIFLYAGSVPNTSLFDGLHTDNGFITVNEKMQTNIDGVFAAGDICAKQVRQAVTAAADGAVAAINAAACIK